MAALDLKNQTTVRIVLCGVLAAAALALFFFTHFVPFGFPNRADQLQTLKAEYEKKSTELARARASVADLPRFEAEYEQLHERWRRSCCPPIARARGCCARSRWRDSRPACSS